jgi:DNA-directed RNA polymerase subunit alpha
MLTILKPRIRLLQQLDRYAKFAVEPLEKGYGHTLGNALRRVLLSSIEGTAVTSIQIDGVLHEFSTIPGVIEDTTEVILNLKELAIRSINGALDGARSARVEARGEGEVTGADVVLPPMMEVVNKEQRIATLSSRHSVLNMTLNIESGKGYQPANRQDKMHKPIGTIPIDAIFTPVRRVNYFVEPTRVGQKTDYDRLVLEIWTNGTIQPADAISQAAKILDTYLQLFFDFAEREEQERKSEEVVERERDRVLDYRIDDLDFSVRTYNCLKRENIETLEDLVRRTDHDLMNIRNFGKKSLTEVKEKLMALGLSLREPPMDEDYEELDEEEVFPQLENEDDDDEDLT